MPPRLVFLSSGALVQPVPVDLVLVIGQSPQLPLTRGAAVLLHHVEAAQVAEGSDEELEQILAAARFKPRDRALVLLLAESGCRADEAAELSIQNLELSDLSAIIDSKGTRRRRIFYTEQAAEAIRFWLDQRPDVEHDYVFVSTRGHGRLTARAVSDIVRRLCRVAGLPRQVGATACGTGSG